jgi:hypothetical protein
VFVHRARQLFLHLRWGGDLRGWLLAPPRARLRERGRLVAAVLEGAWRNPPPPLALSTAELSLVGPLLLATGTAGLAWRRVCASSHIERSVVETLRQAFRAHVLENAVHAHQLGEVTARLRAAGVPALLGKGWAIARLYPEPGLRPYGDLDFYVAPDAHAAALAAIHGAGLPLAPVDLHRGFSDLDELGAEALVARARTVPLKEGEGELSVFGPEDHLRLLCLHGLRHGLSRPLWLCDVAVALETRPAEFDWDLLLGGHRRRAEAVLSALGLAHELLGARTDGTPVAERRLPPWLVPAVERQWGAGSGWRDPMALVLRRHRGVLRELRRHWPNAIEATVGVRAPLNDFPRLPFQLAFTAVRAARWAASVPTALLRARMRRATTAV